MASARSFINEYTRDYYGGALMLLIGVGAVVQGVGYDVGSLSRMGAGFFPVALGTLLALLGIALAGSAKGARHPCRKKKNWHRNGAAGSVLWPACWHLSCSANTAACCPPPLPSYSSRHWETATTFGKRLDPGVRYLRALRTDFLVGLEIAISFVHLGLKS